MIINLDTEKFLKWINQNSKYVPPWIIFEEDLIKYIMEREAEQLQKDKLKDNNNDE